MSQKVLDAIKEREAQKAENAAPPKRTRKPRKATAPKTETETSGTEG